MAAETVGTNRLVSLDQFRGYTVLGMFLVNFASSFAVLPDTIRHHHTHFSYADSIMPQFLFAVGFAFRLTFFRRKETMGTWGAYRRAFVRVFGLLLVGLMIHGIDGNVKSWSELQQLGIGGFFYNAFQRKPFQTLTHIAVTSMWVLPVITAGPIVRLGYAAASGILFWYLSQQYYYTWVMTRPGIDGGPLGFLTWATPLLVGSLAYDVVQTSSPLVAVRRLLLWGSLLMLFGYGLSCLSRGLDPQATSVFADPPFVAPENSDEIRNRLSKQPENARHLFWIMSQRAGSPSYLVFGAGFSMALYGVFVLLCDVGSWRANVLETLGANALAAYVIHDVVGAALGGYKPKDAPLWFALAAFATFFAICYLFLRHLEKHRLFLRL